MNLFWDFFTYIYRMLYTPTNNINDECKEEYELKERELKERELKDAEYTFIFSRE